MALYLCLNQDGTGVVSEQNPIQTKHTSNGEPKTVPVYIFNDGKRKGVPNDANPPALIYTNIQVRVEGVGHDLEVAISPSNSDVNVVFDSIEGWNIGTIIKSGMERMRVEELVTSNSVRVQRNYTADGGSSTISGHSIGAKFIAEATSVSVALPDMNNPENPGTFLSGGEALTKGLDPSYLNTAVNDNEAANIIKSTKASQYSVGSIIKIDKEEMKVLTVSGNDLIVLRGFNGTARESHSQNSIIYLVGMNDIKKTHKVFLRNDPPPGLPTQKKADVKIVIVADEEPV